MSMLFAASAVYAYRGGAKDDIGRAVLARFGVVAVESTGDTMMWAFPLLAVVDAQACYFLADWFIYAKPALDCTSAAFAFDPNATWSNATDPLARCPPPFLPFEHDVAKCCQIVNTHFDLTAFLGSVGGNIVGGYTFVNAVANVCLWADHTVKRKGDATELAQAQVLAKLEMSAAARV